MIQKIKNEIAKTIIGQDELIDSMLICLLTDGHILLEGVPGVAKTTAVNSLCKSIGLEFGRVQFTADMLPSDIIGHEMLDIKTNEFKIKQGPIFTNLLLADEINRASPKAQSALLEAMAERQVTIGDESMKLSKPFMILATSNPVDQDGTYRLPAASLDRFMMKVDVGYSSIEQEYEIMLKAANNAFAPLEQVATADDLFACQKQTHDTHIDEELSRYILQIIFATREPAKYGLEELEQYIDYGASPRASIDLYKASKARAYLDAKEFVTPHDVIRVAYGILRHRIVLKYQALSDGVTTDMVIKKIISAINIP